MCVCTHMCKYTHACVDVSATKLLAQHRNDIEHITMPMVQRVIGAPSKAPPSPKHSIAILSLCYTT